MWKEFSGPRRGGRVVECSGLGGELPLSHSVRLSPSRPARSSDCSDCCPSLSGLSRQEPLCLPTNFPTPFPGNWFGTNPGEVESTGRCRHAEIFAATPLAEVRPQRTGVHL